MSSEPGSVSEFAGTVPVGDLGSDRSWLSNGSNPASAGTEPETAVSDSGGRKSVDELVSRVLSSYPERCMVPLSVTHGQKLREDCLDEPVTDGQTVAVGEHETVLNEATVRRDALPLIDALENMLRWHDGYGSKSLRMARGSRVRGDYESFQVSLETSYSPEYQDRQYAQLMAMERQFIGDTYPNGVDCEGLYDEPVTLLLGLTTSSLDSGGSYRPMVDHDREIREAWNGSSDSVKRTLRYVLEDKLGLSPGEYAWWFQSEPHPGGGDASGYFHAHPVVIFDGAAVTGSADPLDPETYRSVISKHIELCPNATWSAHEINETDDSSVSVRKASEVGNLATYVSDYIAVEPGMDLFDRSDEYLLYAASQWASPTKKYSRSRWAGEAIKADACQQQYHDGETVQSVPHGEEVVRTDKRPGISYECSECGSAHGVDQSPESLAAHRLCDPFPDKESREEPQSGLSFEQRWPSARAGGRFGGGSSGTVVRWCSHDWGATECPLCQPSKWDVPTTVPIPADAFDPSELIGCLDRVGSAGGSGECVVEGFDRPPEWRPEAVVCGESGEETVIGSPGGVQYGEVVVEGAGSVMGRSSLPYLPPPSWLEGPEPWVGRSVFNEADVREGRVPPPELVAREWAETLRADRRVTRKQWRPDWYAERFEAVGVSGDDCEPQLASGVSRSIVELVRTESIRSVPSVLGRLGIDPRHADEVRVVVEGVG